MDYLVVTPIPQSKKRTSAYAYIIAAIAVLGAIAGVVAAYQYQSVTTTLVASNELESTLLSDLFSQWKLTYQKSYATEEEEAHRFQTFQDNYAFIVKFNADKTQTSTVGLNKFADLNTVEFGALMNCLEPKKEHIPTPGIKETPLGFLPVSFFWNTQGAVTGVKNQGQCGSCWAFSATGGLEGLAHIQGHPPMDFSEQQLIDCSGSYGNNGCNGGYFDAAYEYSAVYRNEEEATYPYTAVQGSCQYNPGSAYQITWRHVDIAPDDWVALGWGVMVNPVSVTVEADQPVFQLYTSGIINTAACGQAVDHAVLVIGFDIDQNFWFIKNSWGIDWGMNGFAYIAIVGPTYGSGVCGIYTNPSYPQ
jgi:cathepsin L